MLLLRPSCLHIAKVQIASMPAANSVLSSEALSHGNSDRAMIFRKLQTVNCPGAAAENDVEP